jgi:hypothetical protein
MKCSVSARFHHMGNTFLPSSIPDADTMRDKDVKLEVTCVRFKQESQTTVSLQNELLLRKFVGEVQGQVQTVSSALALGGALATVTPAKAPTTTYRGPLEITPSLKINVRQLVSKRSLKRRVPHILKWGKVPR